MEIDINVHFNCIHVRLLLNLFPSCLEQAGKQVCCVQGISSFGVRAMRLRKEGAMMQCHNLSVSPDNVLLVVRYGMLLPDSP
jgi:hypothetical protein